MEIYKFQKFNPKFGRIIIIFKHKFCKDGKIRKIINGNQPDDKHINYYDNDNEFFLTDHLTYKCTNYIFENSYNISYDEEEEQHQEVVDNDNDENSYVQNNTTYTSESSENNDNINNDNINNDNINNDNINNNNINNGNIYEEWMTEYDDYSEGDELDSVS